MATHSHSSSSGDTPLFTLRSLLTLTLLVGVFLALGFRDIPLIVAVAATITLLTKRTRGWAPAVVICFLFIVVLSILDIGKSASFRLDTGDRRLYRFGIQVADHPMRDSAREALLSLNNPLVPEKWEWCAYSVGSNNTSAMVYSFYYKASAWVKEDPEIAKLVVRDLADYLQSTHGNRDLPKCTVMIFPDVVDDSLNPPQVINGWEKNPDVLWYLASNGYSLHDDRQE